MDKTGNYRNYFGAIYRDNGKENGNYYIIIGHIVGLFMENGQWKLL